MIAPCLPSDYELSRLTRARRDSSPLPTECDLRLQSFSDRDMTHLWDLRFINGRVNTSVGLMKELPYLGRKEV